MVSNLDIQKWQIATNGINESGQQDLNQEEWSALVLLNSYLQNGNFESDESRHAIALLKSYSSRHGNNQILQMHLQNFIGLCNKYLNTMASSAFVPTAGNTNSQTVNTSDNTSKNSRRESGSMRTVIIIAVVLLVGYVIVKNSGWLSNPHSGGLNANDNYTIEVKIPNGNQYSNLIDSVDFAGSKNKVYYNNGIFTLKLKDLPENILKPLSDVNDPMITFKGAIISDPNTRCFHNEGFISASSKKGMALIYLANQDMVRYMESKNVNDFKWMIPLYVDRKCNVSGSTSYSENIVTYSLSLKKGWNKVYIYIQEEAKNGGLTTTPLSGLEWRVWWEKR